MDDIKSHMREEMRGGMHRANNLSSKRMEDNTATKRVNIQKLPVRIRPADHNDQNLIYSSWLKSYAALNKDQPKMVVWKLHAPVVKQLLERSVTLVACDKEEGDNVYAWMCAERTPKFFVLHFAYTKSMFRRWGLQKALVRGFDYKKGEAVMCSHRSHLIKSLKKLGHNIVHVPHLQHPGGPEAVAAAYAPKNAKKDIL
tara:strand:+ start:472 stop:1068 length:597 start_codon:yes stop_codon:yes gene_type:complete